MRVLIAHADSKARETLTGVVTRRSDEYVEVVTAEDGSETLDLLLQEDPPEVALVDWDLPGIEGPEMCRLVRDFHHGHDTHLVVLASSSHTDTVDAWRAGAADCIQTPAPADTLWAAVEKGLCARGASQVQAGVRDSAAVALDSVDGAWDTAAGGWDPAAGAWGSGDDADMSAEDDEPAMLDALCSGEGAADDFFGFGAPDLSARTEHDQRPASRSERRETEEPRGAALLQAVIGEF